MSFKEIKELRQAGKFEEALELAKQAIEAEPENIWNKRALGWVHYDYLKKNNSPDNFSQFKEHLLSIKDLNLPEGEKMIFDNCAWQIGSLVFSLQKKEPINYSQINELFDIISDFHFTKPSESYSLLYKAFHKGYQNWSRYIEFADWWDFNHLRAEDYLKEEFNGKKIMATAEQAYIAYCKKILEGVPMDSLGVQRIVDTEKLKIFLPKLDALIIKEPSYQYPPYFKAKLLLAMGSKEHLLSTFLPFARQKRNDFWVWELMAEIFQSEKNIQFACYCKALTLNTPEDFLIKLRQTFTQQLIERKMYNEAKTEISKILETRNKHQWKIPAMIVLWTQESWYAVANAKKDNAELYSQFAKEAEEILFQDVPEEIVVVEFVNESKSMLNFVKNRLKHGFFSYAGIIQKVKIGDILKVRFKGDGKDGFFKVVTAKPADTGAISESIKSFQGNVKIVSPQNFGFVEDIFIDPALIKEKNLFDKMLVSGKAILSFNKKKNEWGWKAIGIESN
jgi:hypothetical protein